MTDPRPVDHRVRSRGLRGRVSLALGASIVVAVAAVAGVALVLLSRSLHAAADRAARDETRGAVALVRSELDDPSPASLTSIDQQLASVGQFEVVLVRGEQVASSRRGLGLVDVPARAREPGSESIVVPTVADGDAWLVTATGVDPRTSLYLFFPEAGTTRDVAVAGRVILATAAVVALLGVLVSASIGRRVLAPVERTAAAARELAAGALATRVPAVERDPSDLVATFNEMAAALEQMVASLEASAAAQRRFVADVSHELRTPVTALSTATDLVEPQLDRLDGAARRAAELLVVEVRQLRDLVDDLMEISRLDAEPHPDEPEPVEVGALVPRVLQQRGHEEVTWTVAPGTVAAGDPRRVSVIVGNLIDNAVQHGRPPVEVAATVHDETVRIDVRDHGPGVPAAHRTAIFARFTKADEARTRSRGSGLGLAIVREHVRLMGGEVTLADPGPGTTVFRVTLPRWHDEGGG